jgi:hypothetical protein
MDPNAVDALYPGDLDKMFLNIITDPVYQQYEPRVVSRPSLAPGDTKETADYLVGGPWMVIFENTVTAEEAQRLRELGDEMGYKRSEDVGTKKEDGTFTSVVNSGRTSTNAWCIDECYQNPIAQRVMARIENITGIPERNSESCRYDTFACEEDPSMTGLTLLYFLHPPQLFYQFYSCCNTPKLNFTTLIPITFHFSSNDNRVLES